MSTDSANYLSVQDKNLDYKVNFLMSLNIYYFFFSGPPEDMMFGNMTVVWFQILAGGKNNEPTAVPKMQQIKRKF